MSTRQQRAMRLVAVFALAAPLWVSAAPASAAQDDLINASPTSVSFDTPGPGHADGWTMSVTNVTTVDVPLSLRVDGAHSPLFAGATPLQIVIREAGGETVAGPVAAGELIGTLIPLPTLPAGTTYVLSGTAALPRDADNGYQGLSGELTFRFTATDPRVSLAQTGSVVPLTAVAAAAVILLSGLLLLGRRKARTHA